MSKLLLMMPTQRMYEQAQRLIPTLGVEAEALLASSRNVVQQVTQAQERGALVAVARGNQAYLIQRHTSLPVVEVVLSGQAIVDLIAAAKARLKTPHPNLAFVGFRNMFTDTSPFEAPLDVSIRNYYVEDSAQIPLAVDQAREDGMDLVIGGEIAMQRAREAGLPSLFVESTEDSIREAIEEALRILRAVELERQNTTEVMTILNYSFNGVLRLDQHGIITLANHLAEKVFRQNRQALIGRPVSDLLDVQPGDPIDRALREGHNSYATILRYKNLALVANVAAIAPQGQVEGVIFSFQEFGAIDELEEGIRQERYDMGYKADLHFGDLSVASPAMRRLRATAEKYAKLDLPVMIRGELGTGKRMLAQCVHNASLRSHSPFVSMDCRGLPAQVQQSMLMGGRAGRESGIAQKGFLEIAHKGTLFLTGVEELDPFCQYQLLRVLREKCIMIDNSTKVLPLDVRILCASDRDLRQCVQDGRLNETLYCLLTQLELYVPPLRERPEDLRLAVDRSLDSYNKLYHKYVTLTDAARAVIAAHPWMGNMLQLELFLEKLVILADVALLDETFVAAQLPLQFEAPQTVGKRAMPQPVVYQTPERDELLRLLDEHQGRRSEVAKAMNISKSTLWRRMKRYGIAQRYESNLSSD